MQDKTGSPHESSQHQIVESPQERRRFSLFPKPLSDSLTRLVKPVYKKHGFAEHRILTEWKMIVGDDLAAYSVPEKLTSSRGREGGTLHVLVASARALELQHMQPLILSKIATYFGYAAVTRLAFVQTHSPLFHKAKAQSVSHSQPPDEALVNLTRQCEDERLRLALLALGNAIAAKP